MKARPLSVAARIVALLTCLFALNTATTVHAQTAAPSAPKPPAEEPMPKFDAAYLKSAAAIKVGEGVWTNQCRHCHGNAAYPGKAPKLSPGAMDPEFIFDRVTYGFRKMPGWKEAFTLEERKGVVAYIKSDRFAP